MKILLVDDDDDTRAACRKQLERNGHRVHEAENGAVAVERVSGTRYHLVLMDLNMPVMDGFEAARRIRAFERAQDLDPACIVACSTTAQWYGSDGRLPGEIDWYVAKPITSSALSQPPGSWCAPTTPVGDASESADAPRPGPRMTGSNGDLVERYLTQRREDVRAVRNRLAQPDYAEIRHRGHKMAGSGAAFGFPEITMWGLTIETAAIRRDAPAIRSALEGLASYLDRLPGSPEAGRRDDPDAGPVAEAPLGA